MIREVGDGLIAWGVAVGIVGLVASAIMWALGANSENYQHASRGKKGVIYVLLAMALIGAAPVLVQWAFDLGGTAS